MSAPPQMHVLPENRAAIEVVMQGGQSACPVTVIFNAGGAIVGLETTALSALISDGERILAGRIAKLAAAIARYRSVSAAQTELVVALRLANRLAEIEHEHGHRAIALLEGGA